MGIETIYRCDRCQGVIDEYISFDEHFALTVRVYDAIANDHEHYEFCDKCAPIIKAATLSILEVEHDNA